LAKVAKWAPLSSTAVPLEARAVASSLVLGLFQIVGATTMPMSGTAMLDIFALDLHIFGLNQLQILFLLLQDSIFQIFILEIK